MTKPTASPLIYQYLCNGYSDTPSDNILNQLYCTKLDAIYVVLPKGLNMDYNTWFSLLRKQLDAVTAGLAGNASEAKFLDVVKELARNPNLVAGKDKNMLHAIYCLILAGAVSTGEIKEVGNLLETYCCNESAPFNAEIIREVVGTFTEQ